MSFKREIIHFKLNKRQRNGLFFLLLIIVALQTGYYLISKDTPQLKINNPELLAYQKQLDSIKQIQADYKPTIYPFNPNFITDYKGYTLGMTVEQINKLHSYRAKGKFVNSAEEFKQLTGVSQEFIDTWSPYFKFPDWVNKPKKENTFQKNTKTEAIALSDLNTATAEDLKKVNGIGDKLSERIVKYREKLGGFLVEDQLAEVYGLSPEVVQETLKYFKILSKPDIVTVDVNKASIKQLTSVPNISYQLAKKIVMLRSSKGHINSLEELTKIEEFPLQKFNIIALYLKIE